MGTEKPLGVFICHCGDNISGTVDIDRLKNALTEDNLACIEECPYLCSVEGHDLIKEKIRSFDLERVVIAACSPQLHEKRFRDVVEEAGINRYLLDVANIREQCAWVDKDQDPTFRAIDQVRSSLNAVQKTDTRKKISSPVTRSVLIIGGGISGITAALSLARQNINVYMVEKSPTIGGNMVKVGKVFSAEDLSEECALCSLAPLMGEVAEKPNIELLTLSEVTDVTGYPGNFQVKIKTGPALVDREKCTSCGSCTEVCSVTTPDQWNASLVGRKAIYRPFAQAIPSSYTIDIESCTKCGSCLEVCSAGAINLEAYAEEDEINVGAIIIATGYEELNPEEKVEFGYGKYSGVLTQMELARVLAVNGPTSGKLLNPNTMVKPRRIVMVQCVGSRDRKPGSIPHCSTICCMTALKHANYISSHFKDTEVYICYTDMRTPGTQENYYFETQKKGEKNIRFIRGRVAEVKEEDGLMVRVEDTLGGGVIEIDTDMVVLSCAIMPSKNINSVEEALGVILTPERFVKEKHPKMEPTQTTVPGIYVSGTAKSAMDITDTINMSRSAASRVSELLSSDKIYIDPEFAVVDEYKCEGCATCVKTCPMDAIFVEGNVQIHPILCNGCGACIGKCPQDAIKLPGSSDEELMGRIDGQLRSGPVVLAFLDRDIAYVAADNMGMNHLNYPDDIRIIRVPSILRLEVAHLLHAFKSGVKGIFLGDGTGNALGSSMVSKLTEKVDELREGVKSSGINPERVMFYEAYLPHHKGLSKKFKEFSENLDKK